VVENFLEFGGGRFAIVGSQERLPAPEGRVKTGNVGDEGGLHRGLLDHRPKSTGHAPSACALRDFLPHYPDDGGSDGSQGRLYMIHDLNFIGSNLQKAVAALAKSQELVRLRWKPISKLDILKIAQKRKTLQPPGQ
jgi:hypothetical protein